MKNPRDQIKKDLAGLSKSLDFSIIRNYEFLFDSKKNFESDLDLLSVNLTKAHTKTLEKQGYFLVSDSKYRVVFAKYFPEAKQLFFLDFHKYNLTGNPISYGLEKTALSNKKFMKGIPVFSEEYYFSALLMRELIAEGFRDKYKDRLKLLLAKSNKKTLARLLSINLRKKTARKVISYLLQGEFTHLNKLRKRIKYKFVMKNLLSYFQAALLSKRKKSKTIAVIGMDGSGKTTLVDECVPILIKSGIGVNRLYLGRGGHNVLSVKSPARLVKNRIIHKKPRTQVLFYSFGSFIYALDLFIRQIFHSNSLIWDKKNKLSISDRFSSDILLMPNVPRILKKALHFILPKANLYIYIYNNISILSERGGHNIQDLKRQENEFVWINKLLKSKKIENKNIESTIEDVLKLILCHKS